MSPVETIFTIRHIIRYAEKVAPDPFPDTTMMERAKMILRRFMDQLVTRAEVKSYQVIDRPDGHLEVAFELPAEIKYMALTVDLREDSNPLSKLSTMFDYY